MNMILFEYAVASWHGFEIIVKSRTCPSTPFRKLKNRRNGNRHSLYLLLVFEILYLQLDTLDSFFTMYDCRAFISTFVVNTIRWCWQKIFWEDHKSVGAMQQKLGWPLLMRFRKGNFHRALHCSKSTRHFLLTCYHDTWYNSQIRNSMRQKTIRAKNRWSIQDRNDRRQPNYCCCITLNEDE